MKDYTVEQEDGKWFIWDVDGDCINEKEPCNTEEEAWNFIPPYLAEKEERAWERHMEDLIEGGHTASTNRGEQQERMSEYQKLK